MVRHAALPTVRRPAEGAMRVTPTTPLAPVACHEERHARLVPHPMRAAKAGPLLRVEDRSGEAFTGGAAKSFKRMCSEFGIDTAHLRFTYAVRCHARKLTDTSAKACNGFLAAEIERIDPDMIVCVGSLPLRTVAGPSYGIESCAGSPFEHEVLGRKRRMLAIWSPQYMHVFTEKMDKWCEQFQTLAGMIDGSVKIGRGLGTYVQIKTAKEAAAALDAIQTGDVAVDLETNSLDPKRKEIGRAHV